METRAELPEVDLSEEVVLSENEPVRPTEEVGSILVTDCGHTHTTVILFDLVAGQHRFIAKGTTQSTHAPPLENAAIGIRTAIKEIEEITGRQFLDATGGLIKPARSSDVGIDHFALTVSAARPFRTLLVGLLDEVSISSARRVLGAIHAVEADVFSLNDGRSLQQRVRRVHQLEPELIFITGGTDGGADDRIIKLVNAVAMASFQLPKNKRPPIVYAGNIKLREQVRAVLGEENVIYMTENVRPSLEHENPKDAQRVIGELFSKSNAQGLPGLSTVVNWCDEELPIPTAQAFATIGQYFAALTQGRVFGVDIGSDTAALVCASEQETNVSVYNELGVGRSLTKLLNHISLDEIARWIPIAAEEQILAKPSSKKVVEAAEETEDSSEEAEEPELVAEEIYQFSELESYLLNQPLFPNVLPTTERELHWHQAVVRALLRFMARDTADKWRWEESSPPIFNLLLLRGSALVNTPRSVQAILMVLDALQPKGMFAVALDKYHVLPGLGAMAQKLPVAAVQALEGGTLVDLGWVIVISGSGRPNRKVLSVKVESDLTGVLELDVNWGQLEILPIPPNIEVKLTLRPRRGFDVGFGPGKKTTVTVRGGEVGLVIDARGRPLPTPSDIGEHQALMHRWLTTVGG